MNERVSQQNVLSTISPGTSQKVLAPSRSRAGALPADHGLSRMSVTAPVRIQAELTIGAPDDPLEREADEVADAVMRMPEPEARPPVIQRACAGCAEEEQLQTLPLDAAAFQATTLQRMETPNEDDDEQLQTSPVGSGMVAAPSGGLVASGAASAQVAAARQGGAPLSSSERDFFQPRLAHDLSAVRVHSGPAAAKAAASVGARAFTVGPDIVLGAGQPAPSTAAGRRLFAHELAHVVQQGHAAALDPKEER